MLEVQEESQTGWLTRSTSRLKSYFSGVTESVLEHMSPRSPRDPFLDQQL
uniref:Plant intracellular Ras-group-related LRR protein 9-like n=1 Tax=Rhizophora mucronata TaxID=61149 RepID=A0A2P2QP49_RHIMU